MEYEVELFGNIYTLPKYSISIADKLEKVEEGNRSNIDFKSKCKNMYNNKKQAYFVETQKEGI